MGSFQRSHVETVALRLAEPPSRIVAVFGPRQTGKTEIVRQTLERIPQGSWYISVDEPDTRRLRVSVESIAVESVLMPQRRDTEWLVEQWEQARRRADRAGRDGRWFVLVLDEIQKVPNWSDAVKGLWDADRARECPLHVVILGSAPLLMQSGLQESLAGRFEPVRVAHWSFPEMASAFGFDLPRYLYFGGYPGAAHLVRDPDRWREYVLHALVEPNIERDILAMTRVDKPALLKRLFELGAHYSGQILSYTKMLGQLHDAGNTTTLARYLELLGHAGLIAGLPKHADRPLIGKGSSPKLNVLNTAMMTAGSGYSFDEAQADRTFWGRVVESAVGAHLLNTATANIELRYWRDNPHEVDFVLRRGSALVAIEVKSGPTSPSTRGPSTIGMTKFRNRFEPLRSLLVGGGGVPLEEFLSVPAEDWFEES